MGDHARVRTGRDDELRAGIDRRIGLFDGQHRARANQDVRTPSSDRVDGMRGSPGAEGNLQAGNPGCGEDLGQRQPKLRPRELDDGNDPDPMQAQRQVRLAASAAHDRLGPDAFGGIGQPGKEAGGDLEPKDFGDVLRPGVDEVAPAIVHQQVACCLLRSRKVQELELAAIVELPSDAALRKGRSVRQR